METAIIVALITGAATVIAAAIAILPKILQRKFLVPAPGSLLASAEGGGSSGGPRIVYYRGKTSLPELWRQELPDRTN